MPKEKKNHPKRSNGSKLVPRCRRLKILSGPHQMGFYPNVLGRRVLLLGEVHRFEKMADEKNPNTQEIHRWLAEMAANAPECLDIILENNQYSTGFASREPFDEQEKLDFKKVKTLKQMHRQLQKDYPGVEADFSGLVASCITFEPCRLRSRLNCFGESIRLHNMDLRSLFEESKDKQDPFDLKGRRSDVSDIRQQMLLKNAKYGKKPKIVNDLSFVPCIQPAEKGMAKYVRMYENSCKYLAGLEMYKRDYYKMIIIILETFDMENHLPMGAYDLDMHDTYMKRTYMYRIRKSQEKIGEEISLKLLEALLTSWTVPQFQIHVQFVEDKKFMRSPMFWHLNAFVVDYYALLRLFTVFKTKMDMGPTGCSDDKYKTLKNVIMYAGTLHISGIMATLDGLGFTKSLQLTQPSVNNLPTKNYITFEKPFDLWSSK
jgi:hypothetical protein